MLVARGQTTIGKASLRWAMLFGARVHAFVIHRRGLIYDTRFVPPSPGPSKGRPVLFVLSEGALIEDGEHARGPCARVVSDALLDGVKGKRSWSYRAVGEPFSLIQLHPHPDETSLRAAASPAPIVLDESTWSAARHLSAAATGDEPALVRAFVDFVRALEQQSVVTAALVESALEPTPRPFQLLWKGLRPIIDRLELRPTLKELTSASGATSREVDRVVRAFVSAFGLVGGSWRDASRFWRLKLALLFLSAEGVTVAEIATAVGYGSTDAMGRAFRDARLPAPSVVQAEMLSHRR